MSNKKICIVGAGTVGLSAALFLAKEAASRSKQTKIVVVAEGFVEDTTSFGSGGLWEPYAIAGTPEDVVNSWGKDSFDWFAAFLGSPDAARAGVQLLTSYKVYDDSYKDTPLPSFKDIVLNFKELSSSDLRRLNLPDKFVYGVTFGTIVVEQKYYMRYLMEELEKYGVEFEQRRISSIDEFNDSDYDVVVNCAGLGGGTLVGDESMYPIRGQVLRVKAPWMNNVWYLGTATGFAYIIPNVDCVILGGTAQKGDWNTTVSREDTKTIMKNICEVFPSLGDATVENVWVGLRPGRAPLRLDSEIKPIPCSSSSSPPGRTMLVANCYGHGGSGITLSWGCAKDVILNHVFPYLYPDDQH